MPNQKDAQPDTTPDTTPDSQPEATPEAAEPEATEDEATEAEATEAEAEADGAVPEAEDDAAPAAEAAAPEADDAAPEADDAAPEADDAAPEADDAAPEADDAAPEADDAVPPPEDKGPKKKWYVVHTYSGYENRAKQCLYDRIKTEGKDDYFGEILVPTEKVVEVRGGTKRTTQRKFFPGYIIVQMHLDDDTWHLVKGTQKITGFVGDARNPRPLPNREVKRLTEQIEEGTVRAKPKQVFEQGSNVRIAEGPFANFTGTVDEVNADKQKLRVLVSIFGRSTPVEVDFTQVELV